MPGDEERLRSLIAKGRRDQAERNSGYREQSLKLHPWVCGRCGREFERANLQELTVHHKDHNHDNNPADGSNWENLCIYCHDNEHQKYEEQLARGGGAQAEARETGTFKAFAALKDKFPSK